MKQPNGEDLSGLLSENGKTDIFRALAMNFAALSEKEQIRIEPDPLKRAVILAMMGKGPQAPRAKGDPNQSTIDKLDAVLKAHAELERRMKDLHSERLNLVRSWQFQCKACSEYGNLDKFIRVQTYEIDIDGDWNYYGFQYDMLRCPACKEKTYIYNSRQRDELLSATKHIESSIFFATEDCKQGSDGRWY